MKEMRRFQDVETGEIYAFEEGINPLELGYRSVPKTLSANVIEKPSDDYVWLEGTWVHKDQVSPGYQPPISSVPSYDPAWHCLLSPYTLVVRDDEIFSISLDQINNNSYAGDKLAEPVAGIVVAGDVALVSRDGAFALPMRGNLIEQHQAAAAMNTLFCALLVGGVQTESVTHREMIVGCIGEDHRLFMYVPTQHGRFRDMSASISERGVLLFPRVIRVSQLQQASAYGTEVLNRISNLSSYFLLHGYTALRYQNFSDALSSLWITVEQLTTFLLEGKSVDSRRRLPIWEKHKRLLLSEQLSEASHLRLDAAREARNGLLHEGKAPDANIVMGLWPAICELLATASGMSIQKLADMGCWNHQPNKRVNKTNFETWDLLSDRFRQ